jgi:hypothetical protein
LTIKTPSEKISQEVFLFMSMKRTTVDGKTLNERTAKMLALWQFNALRDFYVLQGSYNAGGVKASAGTHDGGGALDISVSGMSFKEKKHNVKQGRLAGFMAYYRPAIPGLWGEHIHAGALGDPEASYGLQHQFAEYRAGQNALADHRPDPDPRVKIRVYPDVKLKTISLLTVNRQFKAKNPVARSSVKRVQWVLNEKLGLNLICDGVAGPKTRAAYKAWEKKIGAKETDGIPGRPGLKRLGAGRFKVAWLSYEKLRTGK